MYYEFYSQFISSWVRVYGPHAYIYKPEDNNKHNINGWIPLVIPVSKLMEFKL